MEYVNEGRCESRYESEMVFRTRIKIIVFKNAGVKVNRNRLWYEERMPGGVGGQR